MSISLKTVGTTALVIRFCNLVVKLDFIFYTLLAAPINFCCDYCNRCVKVIRLRLNQGELENGTVVPIVLQPLKRATKCQVSLTCTQERPLARELTGLRRASAIVRPSKSQVIISFNYHKQGLRNVQPSPGNHEKYQLKISNAVLMITPDRPLQVLVVNLSKQPQRLAKHQFIGSVKSHLLEMLLRPVVSADII